MSQEYSTYLLPLTAAIIGWFTNYIAVKMLFHPKKPTRLLFFNIQGVFPKRQNALAVKLGEVVATELFTQKDLAKAFAENLQGPSLLKKIGEKVENVLTVELPKSFPMIAMFLNAEMVSYIQKTFVDSLADSITSFVKHLGEGVTHSLDIKSIVEEKVRNLSSDKLEEILFALMKKEFRFIEATGAILGFLIGLIQLLLVQSSQW